MPLITCPDCKKKVSDKASACIHCGCPLNDQGKNLPMTSAVAENSSQRKATLIECHSRSGAGKIRDIYTEQILSFSPGDVVGGKFLKDYIDETILYEMDNDRLRIIGPSSAPLNPFFKYSSQSNSSPNKKKQSANVVKNQSKNEARKNADGVTKNYLWYLMVIVILAGYWISKGTPNPDLFFAGSHAKEECLNLAKKNKETSFMFNDNEIEAKDTWLKDGKRVVQLLQADNDGSINQIMCVYGNGMVQIPSLLEQGKWR